ncbi:MAG: rhomboid family intramembrane serine protease [Chitinivibrionales bacterium]|nr:rhomboid family intramembrane serine protease [Chitinivibrionales bacterium]
MMMNPGRKISPAVKWLLIVNIGVYVIQIAPVIGNYVTWFGLLNPALVFTRGHVWRLVTYMFLHSTSIFHILFNMLALWMFGVDLENKWGTRRFAYFYFIGGVGAGLFSVIMWDYPIIGASGAILATLTAYAYYFPHRQILLFFIFPVPIRIAVIIFGAISIMGAMQGTGGIAHITHLGGIVVALLYLKFYGQVVNLFTHIDDLNREKCQRRAAEDSLRRDRYFEATIDPILKKISESGMESLTRQEKKTLEKASKSDKERIKKRKIVPFNIFKS